MAHELLEIALDHPVPLRQLPVTSPEALRTLVVDAVGAGARLVALFGWPADDRGLRVVAVLADPRGAVVRVVATETDGPWRSLTPECPQAHLFERELAEQWGIALAGHPWPRPVRAQPATGADAVSGRPPSPGATDFFRVEGDEVHEVAVGPVHAGVIEPGHFRFQCHGESVLHLEIALGYQHRGVEPRLVGGPDRRTVHVMETVAGDTTVGHTTAYCQLVEALGGARVPVRGMALRAVALELERVANHTGDLGALAGDIGYLPTASFCGRLRGDVLNMTAALCGSRFGRGLVRPGGAGFDVDAPLVTDLRERLSRAEADIRDAVDLLWEQPSVRARFEETGKVMSEHVRALGLVGPVARAAGVPMDARADFPTGFYRVAQIPVSTAASGDVLGRALVRWLEIQRSIAFARETLASLPGGATRTPPPDALTPESFAVTAVEGWRGEIWHVAVTDIAGRFARYKVVDPSFHNWTGLAMALRGQAISDFPLCNKSFNLSYCGFDL